MAQIMNLENGNRFYIVRVEGERVRRTYGVKGTENPKNVIDWLDTRDDAIEKFERVVRRMRDAGWRLAMPADGSFTIPQIVRSYRRAC